MTTYRFNLSFVYNEVLLVNGVVMSMPVLQSWPIMILTELVMELNHNQGHNNYLGIIMGVPTIFLVMGIANWPLLLCMRLFAIV